MNTTARNAGELGYVNRYIDGRLLLLFLPIAVTPTSPAIQRQIPGTGDHLLRTYDIVFPLVNHRPVSVARMKTGTFRPESTQGTSVQLAIFAADNTNDKEDSVPCQSTLAANMRGLETYPDNRMTIHMEPNDCEGNGQHEAFVTSFWEAIRALQRTMCDASSNGDCITSFEAACKRLYVESFENRPEYALPDYLVNAPWFSKCQFCLQLQHSFRIGIIDGGHRLTWMYIQASMMAVLKINVQGNEEYIVVRKPENVQNGEWDTKKIELLVQVCVASSRMTTEEYRRQCHETSDSLVERENFAIPGEAIHEFVKGISLTKRAMLLEEHNNGEINWNNDMKEALGGIVMELKKGVSGREARKSLDRFRQWRCRVRCTMLKALSIVPVNVEEVQKFVAPLPLAHKYRHYRMQRVFIIPECQSIKLRENDSWKLMWQRQGFRVLSVLLDCMVHSVEDADRLSHFFYSSYSFLHHSDSLKKNICHTKLWSFKTVTCVADFVGVLQEYLVSVPALEHLQQEVKDGLQMVSKPLQRALNSNDIKRATLRIQAIQLSPFISAWWTYEFLNQVGLYPSVDYFSWELEGLDSRSEPPDNKTSVYFLTEQILNINRSGDELKPHSKTLRRLLQELLLVPMLESLRADKEEDGFPTDFASFTKHHGLTQRLVSCYVKYVRHSNSPGAKAWMNFYNPLEYELEDNNTKQGLSEDDSVSKHPQENTPVLSKNASGKRQRGLHRNLRMVSEGPRYCRTPKKKRVAKKPRKTTTTSEDKNPDFDSDDEPIAQLIMGPPNSDIGSDNEPITQVVPKGKGSAESQNVTSQKSTDTSDQIAEVPGKSVPESDCGASHEAQLGENASGGNLQGETATLIYNDGHGMVSKQQYEMGTKVRERYMQLKVEALKIQVYYWRAKCRVLCRRTLPAAETTGQTKEVNIKETVGQP